jgi:hypothetical protein
MFFVRFIGFVLVFSTVCSLLAQFVVLSQTSPLWHFALIIYPLEKNGELDDPCELIDIYEFVVVTIPFKSYICSCYFSYDNISTKKDAFSENIMC